MAGEFKEKDYLDFSGGINKNDSDLLLQDNEVQDARNVFSDGKALVKRRGFRSLSSSDTNEISTVYNYKNSQGASYLLKINSAGEFYTIMGAPDGSFDIDETVGGGTPHTLGSVYHYMITYVDFDGRRSLPSETVKYTVQANSASVDLTNIPVGPDNVWYKEIWRTNDGEFDFIHPATPATYRIENSDTTFTDSVGTWSAGTTIKGEELLTDSNYENREKDYHGKDVTFDTTYDTNFVTHKDWAIVCNGIDKKKWRAPMKLDAITADRATILTQDQLRDIYPYEDTFVYTKYAPGMHLRLKDLSDPTDSGYQACCINVDNFDNRVQIRINFGTSAVPTAGTTTYSDYTIVTSGEVVPYGVPKPTKNLDEITSNQYSVTGSIAATGDLHRWKIVNVNMNGSESAAVTTLQESMTANYGVSFGLDKPDATMITTAGTVTITQDSPDTNYAKVEASADFSERFEALNSEEGEEVYIRTGSSGNNGHFRVVSLTSLNSVDCTPTDRVFYIWNPDASTTAALTYDEIQIYKIKRVFSRKMYRTDSSGSGEYYRRDQVYRQEFVIDSAPTNIEVNATLNRFAGDDADWAAITSNLYYNTPKIGDTVKTENFVVDAGANNGTFDVIDGTARTLDVKYQQTLSDESIASGTVVMTLGRLEYRIFIDPFKLTSDTFISDRISETFSQVQPYANDDPPAFRYASSIGGRLIAGWLNYAGLEAQADNGEQHIGVFNYNEVEAMYFLNWTPLGTFGDTTSVNGVSSLTESAVIATGQGLYIASGLDNLGTERLSIQHLDTVGCLGHRSMQRVTRPTGSQTLLFLGTDGLYELWDNGAVIPLGGTSHPTSVRETLGSKANHPLRRILRNALVYRPKEFQNIISSAVQTTDDKYVCNIKYTSNTQNDLMLVYDYRDNAFWLYDGYNARDICNFNGLLVHSSGSSSSYRMYIEQNHNSVDDYMDDGAPIESWAETKYFPMEGMSYVKRWHEITMYPNEYGNYQALNIGTKSEFDNSSTLVGRTAKTLPTGYTDRGADFYNSDTFALEISNTSGDTYRYTSKVKATGLDATHSPTISSLVSSGDRVQIWQSNETDGIAYENLGDFLITDSGDNWFEVTNAQGKEQGSATATLAELGAAGDIIIYGATGTENDSLTYLFKNIILNSDRDAFRVRVLPCSARFLRFRFENVFSTQKLALAGYTIKYGLQSNKGLDR